MKFVVLFPFSNGGNRVEFEISGNSLPAENCMESLISGMDGFSDFYLVKNGLSLMNGDIINDGSEVELRLRLRGGKGGFGSMLRAIGAQIEKTTNREACRDLSGRRLRDINEEKRLKDWLSRQAEREEEAKAKRKARLVKLATEPKHEFVDAAYDQARASVSDRLHAALEKGLEQKRKIDESAPSEPPKKKVAFKSFKGGMMFNPLGSDHSSDDEDSSDDEVTKAEAKELGEKMGLDEMVSTILKQAQSAKDLEELGVDYLQLLVERREIKCDSAELKELAEAIFASLEKVEGGSDEEGKDGNGEIKNGGEGKKCEGEADGAGEEVAPKGGNA